MYTVYVLIYDFKCLKAIADNCNEHIINPQKIGTDDYPYVGKFSPKNIILTGYDDYKEPIFVFLHINIADASFSTALNDSAQQSSFRMTVYDSGKFLIAELCLFCWFIIILVINK